MLLLVSKPQQMTADLFFFLILCCLSALCKKSGATVELRTSLTGDEDCMVIMFSLCFLFCLLLDWCLGYLFSFVYFLHYLQFFTDPCASSPCLHGNCSRSDGGEEGELAFTCECSEGYEGERCDQILLDLPPADWDPATPSAPEPATPVASTTTATTQPQQPTTVPSTTTEAPPTLQPWQPKPGQRLLVVPWEEDRVRTSLINFISNRFMYKMSKELMLCVICVCVCFRWLRVCTVWALSFVSWHQELWLCLLRCLKRQM